MTDSIPLIVTWIGYATSMAAFFIALVKVYRKFSQKFAKIMNGQMCELRTDITAIYYKHVDEAEPALREYERQNLDEFFEAYEALKGNTFVKDIYNKMRTWKVVT